MNKKIIGSFGEEIAAEYLKGVGYKILKRNYSVKGAEIDIIARDGKTVVFVEVKARENLNFGYPAEAVTKSKRHKIVMAAECYIVQNRIADREFRFDVVEVLGGEVNHIKDAFYAN